MLYAITPSPHIQISGLLIFGEDGNGRAWVSGLVWLCVCVFDHDGSNRFDDIHTSILCVSCV